MRKAVFSGALLTLAALGAGVGSLSSVGAQESKAASAAAQETEEEIKERAIRLQCFVFEDSHGALDRCSEALIGFVLGNAQHFRGRGHPFADETPAVFEQAAHPFAACGILDLDARPAPQEHFADRA